MIADQARRKQHAFERLTACVKIKKRGFWILRKNLIIPQQKMNELFDSGVLNYHMKMVKAGIHHN